MKLDVIASRGRHGTFSVIVVAAAIAIVIVAVARQPDPVKRALLLRRAGFTWMALFAFFFGAFIVGDTFTGPGGWRAAGLVAAWAVPLAGLAALAWYRPSWAIYVFAVLTVAVIGVSIWFAVNPQGWRSFEDQHGPIRAVITFVLVAAITVLGLNGRPRPGCCCSSPASSRSPCPAWAVCWVLPHCRW